MISTFTFQYGEIKSPKIFRENAAWGHLHSSMERLKGDTNEGFRNGLISFTFQYGEIKRSTFIIKGYDSCDLHSSMERLKV